MKTENIKEDDEVWVLTQEVIVQLALEDFGINVNITMAKAIWNEIVDRMVKSGYMGKEEE